MSFAVAKSSPQALVGTPSSLATLSGTPARTSVLEIGENRRCTIEVFYNSAAASCGVEILPLLAADSIKPSVTSDVWTIPGVWDGTVTAANADSVAASAGYTVSPNFNEVVHRPIALRTEPSTASSEKIRVSFSLNVEAHRWLCLQYVEYGASNGDACIRVIFHA